VTHPLGVSAVGYIFLPQEMFHEFLLVTGMLYYSSCIARRARGVLMQDVVAMAKTLLQVHMDVLQCSATEGAGFKKLISKTQTANFQL
jgi:hypothetical protein